MITLFSPHSPLKPQSIPKFPVLHELEIRKNKTKQNPPKPFGFLCESQIRVNCKSSNHSPETKKSATI